MRQAAWRAIRHIPAYFGLLAGLLRDRRVSRVDRALVFAAMAYVLSPLDFLPDVIPFFGQLDDVLLVVMALQRLIDRAGSEVVRAHWRGDPSALSSAALSRVVTVASLFLPGGIRRRLRRLVVRKLWRG